LRGYAAGLFSIPGTVESALRKLDLSGLDLRLLEQDPSSTGKLLYTRGRPGTAGHEARGMGADAAHSFAETIDFGGRHYRLEVWATSTSLNVARSWQAWLVLAVGLFFIRVMGAVMFMSTGRASRAQHTLEERIRINLELEERVRTRTIQLRANLKEREVLLQEVHHRVRNNLQVISSLINMQVRQSTEQKNRDALTDCRTRIEAIALIHEALYQSDDYSEIPFSEYARNLSTNLFHLAAVAPSMVALELEIADVALTVDKAIPCGLILNELVINALKHAFPEGRRGTVRIGLRHVGPERLALRVEDDGVGMPAHVDLSRSGRLGLQLVRTLAGQLDAELSVRREGGTSFELSFLAKGKREWQARRELEY
jgi:two-component sensor histidine kinase